MIFIVLLCTIVIYSYSTVDLYHQLLVTTKQHLRSATGRPPGEVNQPNLGQEDDQNIRTKQESKLKPQQKEAKTNPQEKSNKPERKKKLFPSNLLASFQAGEHVLTRIKASGAQQLVEHLRENIQVLAKMEKHNGFKHVLKSQIRL